MNPPKNRSNLDEFVNDKSINYLGKPAKNMTYDFNFSNKVNLISNLKQQLGKSNGHDQIQSETVKILKAFYKKSTQLIEKSFKKNPESSKNVTRAYSKLTDKTLEAVFFVCEEFLYPDSSKEVKEFAVISVGGYGREKMAPYSDIDILFLVPKQITKRVHGIIETTLYILWDLKLKVGHATRNIKECIKLLIQGPSLIPSHLFLRLFLRKFLGNLKRFLVVG